MSVSIIMGLALELSEDKFPNIRLSVELSLPPHTRGGSASRLVASSATAPHKQSRASCCA